MRQDYGKWSKVRFGVYANKGKNAMLTAKTKVHREEEQCFKRNWSEISLDGNYETSLRKFSYFTISADFNCEKAMFSRDQELPAAELG